jgi:hypothetical protein
VETKKASIRIDSFAVEAATRESPNTSMESNVEQVRRFVFFSIPKRSRIFVPL